MVSALISQLTNKIFGFGKLYTAVTAFMTNMNVKLMEMINIENSIDLDVINGFFCSTVM